MKANYHTHTYRCHHAYNCEWEYVENAIDGGLELLGFADHTPQVYPDGYSSKSKMAPAQLPDYIQTVQRMKELYGDRIEIRCGLEVEYYPALFPALLDLLRQTPGVEYLLLGQHYCDNEYDNHRHATKGTTDEKALIRYVDQVIEAMETGRFLYLCHPDVFRFDGDAELYRTHMRRLCRASNALGFPLELNLQGYRTGKHYPTPDFWAVAGEENCAAIIGADAHKAKSICDPAEIRAMEELAEKYGLRLVERLPLKEDFLK